MRPEGAPTLAFCVLVTIPSKAGRSRTPGEAAARHPGMTTVGCFGDCGFGLSDELERPSQAATAQREYHVKFHPPIQTVLKEKDTEKW